MACSGAGESASGSVCTGQAGWRRPACGRQRDTTVLIRRLGGFLAIADITIHVLRSLIPEGVTFVPNQTILTEGGVEYRVAGTRGSIHDPAIILDCRAT